MVMTENIGVSLRLSNVLGSEAITSDELSKIFNDFGIKFERIIGQGNYGVVLGFDSMGPLNKDRESVVKIELVTTPEWIMDGPYIDGIVGTALNKLESAKLTNGFCTIYDSFTSRNIFDIIDVKNFKRSSIQGTIQVRHKLQKRKDLSVYTPDGKLCDIPDGSNGKPLWCVTVMQKAQVLMRDKLSQLLHDALTSAGYLESEKVIEFLRAICLEFTWTMHCAQEWYRYNHRDSHGGNIMLSSTKHDTDVYGDKFLGVYFKINRKYTDNLNLCIIDQGTARAENVLSSDEDTKSILRDIYSRKEFYETEPNRGESIRVPIDQLIYRKINVETHIRPANINEPEKVIVCTRHVDNAEAIDFRASLGGDRAFPEEFCPGYDFSYFARSLLWENSDALQRLYNIAYVKDYSNLSKDLEQLASFLKACMPDLQDNEIEPYYSTGSLKSSRKKSTRLFPELQDIKYARPITKNRALFGTGISGSLLESQFFEPCLIKENEFDTYKREELMTRDKMGVFELIPRPSDREWSEMDDGTDRGALQRLATSTDPTGINIMNRIKKSIRNMVNLSKIVPKIIGVGMDIVRLPSHDFMEKQHFITPNIRRAMILFLMIEDMQAYNDDECVYLAINIMDRVLSVNYDIDPPLYLALSVMSYYIALHGMGYMENVDYGVVQHITKTNLDLNTLARLHLFIHKTIPVDELFSQTSRSLINRYDEDPQITMSLRNRSRDISNFLCDFLLFKAEPTEFDYRQIACACVYLSSLINLDVRNNVMDLKRNQCDLFSYKLDKNARYVWECVKGIRKYMEIYDPDENDQLSKIYNSDYMRDLIRHQIIKANLYG